MKASRARCLWFPRSSVLFRSPSPLFRGGRGTGTGGTRMGMGFLISSPAGTDGNGWERMGTNLYRAGWRNG